MNVYAGLPTTVKDAAGSRKKKSKQRESGSEVIKGFLPSKRVTSYNLEDFKHKAHVLDSVRKKWKATSNLNSRNTLSARDKRKHKVFEIKPDGHKFESYLPLHRLWKDYMRDILDIKRYLSPGPGQTRENNERLLKADYHGCFIVVRKSKCPSLIGQSGIVLMETKKTFKIIAKDNKIKCLPKAHSVFAFQLDGFLFTIHGDHFCLNPNQRSRKKIKQKPTVDL